MKDFYTTSIISKDILGLDSIQGYLDMAHWYHNGHIKLVDQKKNEKEHGSFIFTLNGLEKDKLINIEWLEYKDDTQEEMLKLKQISLTVQGHKLLDELKDKSKKGRIKKRLSDLLWIIVTTVFTTLLVLKIKGV